MIDPTKVHEALMDSLYTEGEAELTEEGPEGAVVVEAIVGKYALHPERLESHREEVIGWLDQLPTEFHKSGGGGWSFLNACTVEGGELWTGEHRVVEALLALAIGLDLAKWQLPREMWDALPGGMPYVVVNV